MTKKMSGMIVASAVCALFATVSHADDAAKAMPKSKKAGVMCQGHNDCKGKGSCKSEANACKGKNGCAQHAFMAKTKKACTKAKGEVMTEKKADSKG